MQLKLKKDLKVPTWKHVVSTIKKGTVVEFDEKLKIATHPTSTGVSIIVDKPEKYFEQIFLLETSLHFAGKGNSYTEKEWKRIYGYEIGLVAGAKFIPIL
jgi:hypothetical protein